MRRAGLEQIASPAEVDAVLDFVAAGVGPLFMSEAYRARLVQYLRNNFDLALACDAPTPARIAIELTPRGLDMIAALPPEGR